MAEIETDAALVGEIIATIERAHTTAPDDFMREYYAWQLRVVRKLRRGYGEVTALKFLILGVTTPDGAIPKSPNVAVAQQDTFLKHLIEKLDVAIAAKEPFGDR